MNEGRADEGARSVLELAGCLPEQPALRSNFFYAPEGAVSTTVTQGEVAPTVILAPLVIVVRDPDGEASDTIEARDASATFGRPPCLDSVEDRDPARVLLRQGRTEATGTRFQLDRDSDVGDLTGPVRLTRTPEEDGEPVEATADRLRFDLATGRSTLTGAVRIVSGERISEAAQAEIDEDAGVAVLTGEPAVSRLGEDRVEGRRLRYDLETGDVVVQDGVRATFRLREGANENP